MVIGLIRASRPAARAGNSSSSSWHGSHNSTQATSDPGLKDPVVRLSQMLGHTCLVAEQQLSLKRCLDMAAADALSAFDRVGFLESLAVCTDEARAMQKHQDRCAAAWEAFDAALQHKYGTTNMASMTEEEQQQVAATKAQLNVELASIAAAGVQQVRAAAAAAAARRRSTDNSSSTQQQAEVVLEALKAELQHVEDDCTDEAAAQKTCKEAVARHLRSSKAQAAGAGSSPTGHAVLLTKGLLEQHAQHVVAAVRHRAAALSCEAQHAPAAAGALVAGPDSWWHQQGPASKHAGLLQQAHEQRAERVAIDSKLLAEAAQRAVQKMQLQVAQLQAKAWPNAFLAGQHAEEAASQAHEEFVKLAACQHSFAPDSAEYQQHIGQVEEALSCAKQQFIAGVQVLRQRRLQQQ